MDRRNELIVQMAERGIATNVHFKPLPMMTAYKNMGFDIADFPNAYHQYENEITLPLNTKLSDEDVEYIIVNLLGFTCRWRTWGEIPTFMKNDFTLKYYRHLSRKRTSMVFKRIFDVIMSAVLLVLLSPVILVLAVWIKVDSKGPVFFRQERITQYGRKFRIFKFRTMVNDADKRAHW